MQISPSRPCSIRNCDPKITWPLHVDGVFGGAGVPSFGVPPAMWVVPPNGGNTAHYKLPICENHACKMRGLMAKTGCCYDFRS